MMKLIWKNTTDYFDGTTEGFKMRAKVAAFDLDDTLVKTKSKKKFPQDENDWTWKYESVPRILKELGQDGFCVLIVSNQAGLEGNDEKGSSWMKKLEMIVEALGIDMRVLCALSKGKYRKPHTGFVDGIVMTGESFYCGDAVGRPGDFSDSDYKFALNADIQFKTPEHLFLGEKNDLPDVAAGYCIDFKKRSKGMPFSFTSKPNEMIIMVGFPGSGKSTVAKILEQKFGYTCINQDTLKTEAKCKKEAIDKMRKNVSIVIDATNPSKAKRGVWIDLAGEHGYTVRIIQMTTTMEHAKHNNNYRHLVQGCELIPDIAYNMYKSKFEEPNLDEGANVSEIIKQVSGFPDDEQYYKFM